MSSTTIQYNTEPILSEIDNVIKNGLTKLLSEHLNRYELLEKTHQAIMSLPSVLSELNQKPCNSYNSTPQFQEKEKDTDFKSKSMMLFTEDLIKKELDKQYESIIPLFEKMLTKIENLSNEVNKLKNKNTNNITDLAVDLTINEEVPLCVKSEFSEKENIKLEIEETTEFELENDIEDEDNVEEIPAGTKLGGKTWDGDDWETDDEYEDAVEEEDEVVEETDDETVDEDEVVEETDDETVDEDEVVAEEEDEVEENDDAVEETDDAVEEDEDEAVEDVAEEEDEDVEEHDDSVETEKSDSEEETDEEVQKEKETTPEEEDEELFEIDIDDVTYCTNNEENGFIYQLSKDGDVGSKVGYFKEGEPFFYADEN